MAQVKIEKLSEEQVAARDIRSWPIWEKEVSRFDWQYDGNEECLIIDGEVTVETSEGNYTIMPGDFVTFKTGLKCVWDIKKPIRKYYNFP
ncbi:MAG: cupin domain-containing protein [Bacteroidales bacterium]|nr:cupin domain-containing protein [Bacteroidales bacterium]